MKDVCNFLDNLLRVNDTLVVATSGGPDSMCLLHILKSYQDKLNLKIICAHVNHNTRKENEKEKEFVEKYCEENNLIFEYLKIDSYKNNKFTESEGRSKRYEFFESLINKYQAKYLFTAHHGDDLMETVLLRILRGSNLKGYVGIPKVSSYHNYKIVRPLLYINKDEILKYNKENKIKYVLDKTNTKDIHKRNRIRKHVLPYLYKEEKNVYKKFLQYSEELESTNNYLRKIIDKKIAKIYKDGKIYIDALIKEEDFIIKKIIERVIENIQEYDILPIDNKKIESIIKLIKNKDNKEINLNNNYIARVSYNYLIIEKNIKANSYEYVLDKEVNILDKYLIKVEGNSSDTSNKVTRINSEEISLPLRVRSILPGDIIQVKNLKGRKKIKDILINEKIDIKKRKEIPVVVDSKNEIIWLPGIKKSIFDKEIYEKYDIILKYMEGINEYTKK